jgi:peroxiredoxin
MLELGTDAPDFSLADPQGRIYTRDKVKGSSGLLVMFICNHCPFVRHANQELVRIGRDYMQRGIGMVAINSNDYISYPDDSPAKMNVTARELGYPFPYVVDETQQVAKAYKAACTPDFFLFDENLKLVYRGQLDDSRPGNDKAVDGKDLRAAMDAMLSGKPISENQTPSIGCNIKWRTGNEPDYLRQR